jgi:uncharacterized protein (TIGR02611 family)
VGKIMNGYILKGLRQAKRLMIAIIGFTVLLIGIVMIVLPGPAIIIIPLGLAILAGEFVWARSILNKVKDRILTTTKGAHKNETE